MRLQKVKIDEISLSSAPKSDEIQFQRKKGARSLLKRNQSRENKIQRTRGRKRRLTMTKNSKMRLSLEHRKGEEIPPRRKEFKNH